MTREEYLEKAIEKMRPMYRKAGHEIPPVHVSVGWPGGGSPRTRVGEAWSKSASEDGVAHVFISPAIGDVVEALSVLAHELIHTILPKGTGHGAAFRKIAVAIGLAGPMTGTHAGPALVAKLQKIVDRLGKFPHARLSIADRKKQTTRMIKVECLDCGCILRGSRAALEIGAPYCACGAGEMLIDY